MKKRWKFSSNKNKKRKVCNKLNEFNKNVEDNNKAIIYHPNFTNRHLHKALNNVCTF